MPAVSTAIFLGFTVAVGVAGQGVPRSWRLPVRVHPLQDTRLAFSELGRYMLREHSRVRLSQNMGLSRDVNRMECETRGAPWYIIVLDTCLPSNDRLCDKAGWGHLRIDVRFGAAKKRPRHTSNPKHA